MPHPDDLQTPAAHLREPAVDFPWELLDNPEDIACEELSAALGRPVGPAEVRQIFAWHLSRTRADEAAQWTVLERVLLWIGGPRAGHYRAAGRAKERPEETEAETLERRLGIRAAIALAEYAPHSGLGFSTRGIARIFGVSHGEVFRLRENLRATLPVETPKTELPK